MDAVSVDSQPRRLCSLFAGIGGFDLAAKWMGWVTAVMVEWDAFARQVLIKNFNCVPAESLSAAELADIISQWKAWKPGQQHPTTVLYGDICHFDARPWLGAIDLVCGGFPCQPFSDAGKGLGTDDTRHLWPQMLRVIQAIQPLDVVGENVRGLLTRHPLAFERVCLDLEAAGYDVQPFLLPAAGRGAPHHRDRFWFVAHAHRGRWGANQPSIRRGQQDAAGCSDANTLSQQPERWGKPSFLVGSGGKVESQAQQRQRGGYATRHLCPANDWRFRLTEPPLCSSDDGVPTGLVRISNRAKQLKAYGNAIVPQVAFGIFQAIEATEALADG